MQPLSFSVVERAPEVELAPVDARALDELISWRAEPWFAVVGRTAWYVLKQPVLSSDGARLLTAAKLKGVGAFDPTTGKGTRPTNEEYVETAQALHFGVDDAGQFSEVRSEPAPYGAILLRRARQEFDNARLLAQAGVPAIYPLSVCVYDELPKFRGESLGVVTSLTSDASPYSLDWMLVRTQAASARLADRKTVLTCLGAHAFDDSMEGRLSILSATAAKIGILMRQFAKAGLYRYSSGWDNFHINRRTGELYLTDLDSSRRLSELSANVRAMQVLRDMAGTLYRVANKLYHPSNTDAFRLEALLEADPLACVLSGYLDVDLARCRELVVPLWNYFIPHCFLLKRHQPALASWPEALRQSYKMDKNLFHGLAIYSLADAYHSQRARLGLPEAPATEELRASVRRFMGERADMIEFLCGQVRRKNA